MYDSIANLYHLIYEDWDAAIVRQAAALDGVVQNLVGPPPRSILDVSCGIGTQSLGLASLGYTVVASDLSTQAVSRARREATQRGLTIDFAVADMRQIAAVHGNQFDVVLSADNSIPHLPGEEEVRTALVAFYQCLRPGGIAIVGIRDYLPNDDRESPEMQPYGFKAHGGHRYFVYQTRDWADDFYDVAMYFVREASGGEPAQVISGRSRYYPIGVDRVMELFADAGFSEIHRLNDVMHQPLIVGRRTS